MNDKQQVGDLRQMYGFSYDDKVYRFEDLVFRVESSSRRRNSAVFFDNDACELILKVNTAKLAKKDLVFIAEIEQMILLNYAKLHSMQESLQRRLAQRSNLKSVTGDTTGSNLGSNTKVDTENSASVNQALSGNASGQDEVKEGFSEDGSKYYFKDLVFKVEVSSRRKKSAIMFSRATCEFVLKLNKLEYFMRTPEYLRVLKRMVSTSYPKLKQLLQDNLKFKDFNLNKPDVLQYNTNDIVYINGMPYRLEIEYKERFRDEDIWDDGGSNDKAYILQQPQQLALMMVPQGQSRYAGKFEYLYEHGYYHKNLLQELPIIITPTAAEQYNLDLEIAKQRLASLKPNLQETASTDNHDGGSVSFDHAQVNSQNLSQAKDQSKLSPHAQAKVSLHDSMQEKDEQGAVDEQGAIKEEVYQDVMRALPVHAGLILPPRHMKLLMSLYLKRVPLDYAWLFSLDQNLPEFKELEAQYGRAIKSLTTELYCDLWQALNEGYVCQNKFLLDADGQFLKRFFYSPVHTPVKYWLFDRAANMAHTLSLPNGTRFTSVSSPWFTDRLISCSTLNMDYDILCEYEKWVENYAIMQFALSDESCYKTSSLSMVRPELNQAHAPKNTSAVNNNAARVNTNATTDATATASCNSQKPNYNHLGSLQSQMVAEAKSAQGNGDQGQLSHGQSFSEQSLHDGAGARIGATKGSSASDDLSKSTTDSVGNAKHGSNKSDDGAVQTGNQPESTGLSDFKWNTLDDLEGSQDHKLSEGEILVGKSAAVKPEYESNPEHESKVEYEYKLQDGDSSKSSDQGEGFYAFHVDYDPDDEEDNTYYDDGEWFEALGEDGGFVVSPHGSSTVVSHSDDIGNLSLEQLGAGAEELKQAYKPKSGLGAYGEPDFCVRHADFNGIARSYEYQKIRDLVAYPNIDNLGLRNQYVFGSLQNGYWKYVSPAAYTTFTRDPNEQWRLNNLDLLVKSTLEPIPFVPNNLGDDYLAVMFYIFAARNAQDILQAMDEVDRTAKSEVLTPEHSKVNRWEMQGVLQQRLKERKERALLYCNLGQFSQWQRMTEALIDNLELNKILPRTSALRGYVLRDYMNERLMHDFWTWGELKSLENNQGHLTWWPQGKARVAPQYAHPGHTLGLALFRQCARSWPEQHFPILDLLFDKYQDKNFAASERFMTTYLIMQELNAKHQAALKVDQLQSSADNAAAACSPSPAQRTVMQNLDFSLFSQVDNAKVKAKVADIANAKATESTQSFQDSMQPRSELKVGSVSTKLADNKGRELSANQNQAASRAESQAKNHAENGVSVLEHKVKNCTWAAQDFAPESGNTNRTGQKDDDDERINEPVTQDQAAVEFKSMLQCNIGVAAQAPVWFSGVAATEKELELRESQDVMRRLLLQQQADLNRISDQDYVQNHGFTEDDLLKQAISNVENINDYNQNFYRPQMVYANEPEYVGNLTFWQPSAKLCQNPKYDADQAVSDYVIALQNRDYTYPKEWRSASESLSSKKLEDVIQYNEVNNFEIYRKDVVSADGLWVDWDEKRHSFIANLAQRIEPKLDKITAQARSREEKAAAIYDAIKKAKSDEMAMQRLHARSVLLAKSASSDPSLLSEQTARLEQAEQELQGAVKEAQESDKQASEVSLKLKTQAIRMGRAGLQFALERELYDETLESLPDLLLQQFELDRSRQMKAYVNKPVLDEVIDPLRDTYKEFCNKHSEQELSLLQDPLDILNEETSFSVYGVAASLSKPHAIKAGKEHPAIDGAKNAVEAMGQERSALLPGLSVAPFTAAEKSMLVNKAIAQLAGKDAKLSITQQELHGDMLLPGMCWTLGAQGMEIDPAEAVPAVQDIFFNDELDVTPENYFDATGWPVMDAELSRNEPMLAWDLACMFRENTRFEHAAWQAKCWQRGLVRPGVIKVRVIKRSGYRLGIEEDTQSDQARQIRFDALMYFARDRLLHQVLRAVQVFTPTKVIPNLKSNDFMQLVELDLETELLQESAYHYCSLQAMFFAAFESYFNRCLVTAGMSAQGRCSVRYFPSIFYTLSMAQEMISYPMSYIIATVIHEVTHLRFFNHSAKFKHLLNTVCPFNELTNKKWLEIKSLRLTSPKTLRLSKSVNVASILQDKNPLPNQREQLKMFGVFDTAMDDRLSAPDELLWFNGLKVMTNLNMLSTAKRTNRVGKK